MDKKKGRLNLRVLGIFQATLDGAPLVLESNKVRALLIYLMIEPGHPHSREMLADLLWPEQPHRSAMNNLRFALADLRSHLEKKANNSPFLTVTRETIQFNSSSNYWLDAVEFTSITDTHNTSNLSSINDLENAATLYRGSFLEGFSVRNSAPFEEWMRNQREQFAHHIQTILATLAGYYERQGKFQQALKWVRRELDLEPWDEEAHRRAMRLLAFDGQRDAALLQYETCKRSLASELDVFPSAQTTELYESIRDGTIYIPLHFINPEVETTNLSFTRQPTFVARKEELQALTRNLTAAFTNHGRAVFVTGEAGSGKTMLVKEFSRRSQQIYPNMLTMYTNCNAFAGSIDSYLPFIDILRVLAGDIDTQWASGTVDQEQARRLWDALPVVIQVLMESGTNLIDRFIPASELLARARTLEHFQTNKLEKFIEQIASHTAESGPVSGSRRQSEIFEEVNRVLRVISHTYPLLFVIDDLQWADQDTVNLFFYLCRRLIGSRIMIIGAYRLEDTAVPLYSKPSPFLAAVRELQMTSGEAPIDLSHSDVHQFINELLDSEPNALDRDFRTSLEQHTAGIPLFTVELLFSLQERGDLIKDQAGNWITNAILDWETLPPRVEVVIAEQVEQLPIETQQILSIASIEGDEFSAEVISSLLNRPNEDVMAQLSGPLSKSHRIVIPLGVLRAGKKGNRLSRYRFRHHLFQSFFYSHHDIIERARLHEAIGEELEYIYLGQTAEIAVLLARHFECANLREKAATYLLQAGKKAQQLFANEEAIGDFKRGLNLIAFLANSPQRDNLELQLQIALGAPLVATQGYTSPELAQAYTRAHQLIDRCGDSADLFQVLSILKSYYNLRGDPINSRETADIMLRIAEKSGDSELHLIAATKMLTNTFYFGQWNEFRRYIDQTIRLYDAKKHRALTYRIGADPKGVALAFGGMGMWILGFPDQARRHTLAALAVEHEVAIPLWSWFAYYYVAYFHVYAEELEAAQHWINQALHVCTDQGVSHYRVYTECVCGWLMAKHGDKEGIPVQEQCVAWISGIGDRMNSLPLLRLLADTYYTFGLSTQGLDTIEKALEISKQTEMIFEEPELWRLKGELLLTGDESNVAEAERCFMKAIRSASDQGTKIWELRAAVSLGRLWKEQDRVADAYQLLFEVYNRFTEGFDTTDLLEARSLLRELNP
jgi:predicted ATPase/DNA-binding SARP family transcriptional activator